MPIKQASQARSDVQVLTHRFGRFTSRGKYNNYLCFSEALSEWAYHGSRPHEGDVLKSHNGSWEKTQSASVFCEVCQDSGRIEESDLLKKGANA